MITKEERDFWFTAGVFTILWGVNDLLGDIYWWASSDVTWGIFLLSIGSSIVWKVFNKTRRMT
jgi:hypothetical protein